MTPPMATDEQKKNGYGPRLVLAGPCPKCGTLGYVSGYDKKLNGKPRSNLRHCKCYHCGATWKKWPE